MKKEHREKWIEFGKKGLLWYVNKILLAFGWKIVFVYDDKGKLKEVYPQREGDSAIDEVDKVGYSTLKKYFMKDEVNYLRCTFCGLVYDDILYKHGDTSPCCWDMEARLVRYSGKVGRDKQGRLVALDGGRDE